MPACAVFEGRSFEGVRQVEPQRQGETYARCSAIRAQAKRRLEADPGAGRNSAPCGAVRERRSRGHRLATRGMGSGDRRSAVAMWATLLLLRSFERADQQIE